MGQGVQQGDIRTSGNVHPFPVRHRLSWLSDIHFAFRVDNYPHLAAAYGPAVAHTAVETTRRVLADLFGDGGLVMRDGDGLISAFLWDPSVLGPGPVDRGCARLIQAVAESLASQPVHAECQAVHVSISGAWSTPEAEAPKTVRVGQAGGAEAALARLPVHGMGPTDPHWARRFRCDMADAVDLFAMLRAGRVRCAWQAVRSVDGAVLFQQSQLRAAGPVEDYAAPPKLVPALERLGLIQAFDQHIVNQVVAELEAYPWVTLAVSVSALSATLDGWWLRPLERLRRRPDVARRLIVEINTTAPFPCAREAAAFAAHLHQLGCRIATDGFGAGRASIRQLLDIQPDIVKIDPLFLQRAPLSVADLRTFRHVVGLAGALAPVVVAGGAESDRLIKIAQDGGAFWLQGAAVSGAMIPRPWLSRRVPRRKQVSRHDRDACACSASDRGEGAS